MRVSSIVLFMLVLAGQSGCRPRSQQAENLVLYNEALDQIITENYFGHCLPMSGKVEQVHSDFIKQKIDKKTYSRMMDSMLVARKSARPKCVLDYNNRTGYVLDMPKMTKD